MFSRILCIPCDREWEKVRLVESKAAPMRGDLWENGEEHWFDRMHPHVTLTLTSCTKRAPAKYSFCTALYHVNKLIIRINKYIWWGFGIEKMSSVLFCWSIFVMSYDFHGIQIQLCLQLLLHFSHLWTIVQKSVPQIFYRLYIVRFSFMPS